MSDPSPAIEATPQALPQVQHLTAVLELRPTRRKAAALERVRAAAEDVFWAELDRHRPAAEALKGADRKARRIAAGKVNSESARAIVKAGLPESVAAGVARDVAQQFGSYVELAANGHSPSWPERSKPVEVRRREALARCASAATKEHEDAARDEMQRAGREAPHRPFVLVRARDCQLVRDGAGRLAAVLNVLRAKDERSREASIHEGFDAATGEALGASRRKTALVIPVACSRWHENKFLRGKANLKSALIVRRGERWFMCAQFEFPLATAEPSGAVLGIDRGCVYPAVAALVDGTGAVVDVPEPQGREIGETIGRAEDRRRRQQRRRGWTTLRHVRAVDDGLHRLANSIVELARSHRAEVAVEKLGEFKRTIVAPRPKGARKGGWRRVLKKAQLGKLEQILAYKLRMAGLPEPREVLAAGTSQTCAACGHRDAKSRVDRDVFRCVNCGHEAHADANAAIVIARRGVMSRAKIPKGAKLDALHANMVAGLRSRADGGLGPPASRRRVVAAHASADVANDPNAASAAGGLTSPAGQDATRSATENVPRDVLAERGGRSFGEGPDADRNAESGTSPVIGQRDPRNAG